MGSFPGTLIDLGSIVFMILTFYQLCITIRERVKEVAKF